MNKLTFQINDMRLRSTNIQLRGRSIGAILAKASKTKKEKAIAYRNMLSIRNEIEPAYVITLTRISPRKLDSGDNLNGALKSIRDGIAQALRVDDATPLIEWRYKQDFASKKYAVLVEIERTP